MKQLFIDLDKCNGCRECELACAAKQSDTLKSLKRKKDGKLYHPSFKLREGQPIPDSRIAAEKLDRHDPRYSILSTLYETRAPRTQPRDTKPKTPDLVYMPMLCLHCDDAPCIDACISGAMKRDRKTGLIYVDQEQCVGCWSCIMVCPFGVIHRGKSNGQEPARMTRSGGFALKCDGCYDLREPACVTFCEPKALVFCIPSRFSQNTRQEVVKRRIGQLCIT